MAGDNLPGVLDREQKSFFPVGLNLTARKPGDRSGSKTRLSTDGWDGSQGTTHDLQEVR